MDDFETFKSAREKMDPTTRNMSDHQWQQAYAAYRSARERVVGSERKSKKRRPSKSVRGAHTPSSLSSLGLLRSTVRDQSAYADLSLIIDLLAWIAIAVVVLAAVVSLFFYTSMPAALVSLLGAGLEFIGIVVARLLAQVLIDIPDIALYRGIQESSLDRKPSLDSEV